MKTERSGFYFLMVKKSRANPVLIRFHPCSVFAFFLFITDAIFIYH